LSGPPSWRRASEPDRSFLLAGGASSPGDLRRLVEDQRWYDLDFEVACKRQRANGSERHLQGQRRSASLNSLLARSPLKIRTWELCWDAASKTKGPIRRSATANRPNRR